MNEFFANFTTVLQCIAVCVPCIIAVMAYLDKKSTARQKAIQETIGWMLEGLMRIGALTKCNSLDCGNPSKDTLEAIEKYDEYKENLEKFLRKSASKAL